MRPNLSSARIDPQRAERPRQPAETDVFPGLERLGKQRRKRMLAARVAPRANARHTGALVTLAALEGSRGRADEVERLCRCALALAPGMRPARRNLAIALLEMGRHEEAERLLDAMLAADEPARAAAVRAVGAERAAHAVVAANQALRIATKRGMRARAHPLALHARVVAALAA